MSPDDEIFSLSEFFPDGKCLLSLQNLKETREICWSIVQPFSSYKEKKKVECLKASFFWWTRCPIFIMIYLMFSDWHRWTNGSW